MYEVGDKIVYPVYGIGTVEAIETKVTEGEMEEYYIIHIPTGNLKISIMARKMDDMGIRQVGNKEQIAKIFAEVSGRDLVTSPNWNKRYKENLEKIKTGKFLEVTEVLKHLNGRDKEKGLSGAEKKMLQTARQIIIGEIIYSYNIETEKAEELLSDLLLNC